MSIIVTQLDGTPAKVDIVGPAQEGVLTPMWKADRQLWLVADKSHVVEDGDPEAAHLYVGEGHHVPLDEAVKLGAIKKAEAKTQVKEQVKETKQVETAANKQADKPADK